MSIVKMKRIAVIGLDTIKDNLIDKLMEFGTVEILQQQPLTEPTGTDTSRDELVWQRDISEKMEEKIAYYDREISHAEAALATIEKYSYEKPPLFFTRRSMKLKEFQREIHREDRTREDVQRILVLKDNNQRTLDEINRLQAELTSLKPWENYTLPLQIMETKTTKITLGVVPITVDVDGLIEPMESDPINFFVGEVNRDKELIYLVVISKKSDQEQVLAGLRKGGFSQIAFKNLKGTVGDNITSLTAEIAKKKKWASDVEEEIRYNQDTRKSIECLYDHLVMERDKEKIKEKFTKTNRTFYLEGWVPEPSVDQITTLLDENKCIFEFRDPLEDENVPVMTSNNGFVTPFEAVTQMYSQPAYRGFDPTKLFSLFYAIFFGIMLSDAGYGIVLAVVCTIILKKFDLEGMTQKMFKMFFYCGISTIVFGALFGSWFGDFFQVAGRTIFGKEVVINPLWFNPLEDPTRLLIYSLIIGVVHLFLGMGIKAYMLIKEGKLLDAVFDIFTWYMIIGGAAMVLGKSFVGETAADIGMYVAIGGAAILLVTGGRHKKGVGKVLGGISALYGVTGYISDILSYSRLLALGLATGVIAQVVNTMGSIAGGGIFGTLVLLVAFVFGHTFNMAINALGAFVHSSRLQYIEFFGKFYEDGGDDFAPFMRNTKYIRLIND
ncbi:MAG: V-type ATP synthase subunit I [Anaerovoracaceae bacterium]